MLSFTVVWVHDREIDRDLRRLQRGGACSLSLSLSHPGLVDDREIDPDLRVGEGLVHTGDRSGHQALHLDVAHAHHVQGLITVEHQSLDLFFQQLDIHVARTRKEVDTTIL